MDTALKKESTPGREFAELTAQARAAYQEKRARECIDITHRVLLADPGNAEANALHQAVQADIQRDLNDARALLEDSRSMTDGQKYRKAAEIILLKILYLDATHVEAKELLSVAKGSVSAAPVRPTTRPNALDENSFTASPRPVAKEPAPTGTGISLKVPLICVAVVVLAGGLWLFRSRATGTVSEADTAIARPIETRSPVTPADTGRPIVVNSVPAAASRTSTELTPTVSSSYVAPVPGKSTAPPVTDAVVPAPPAPASAPANKPVVSPIANKATGSLAVNSAIAADIYVGDKYLGATPTTLQLQPGRQTIEYRHGDLRTVMTHEIRSGETITAFVTFETTVQINARPWAQVFVEGTSRRALGQTPLSSVRVPIGSVLTFENPNFATKTHRVMEGDSAITMVFQ